MAELVPLHRDKVTHTPLHSPAVVSDTGFEKEGGVLMCILKQDIYIILQQDIYTYTVSWDDWKTGTIQNRYIGPG